jgi:hypothetical protein
MGGPKGPPIIQKGKSMTPTFIDMTEEEFDAAYTPRPNHLNPDASWAIGDGPGCLFDISPKEIQFVRRQNPRTIWTLLDGEDGNLHLVSGYHFVNRVGFLITTAAVPEETSMHVRIEMSQDVQEDAKLNPTKPREMPVDLLAALELVLEHFYPEEAGDYERCGSDDPNHIFHALDRLKQWASS